VGGKHQDIAQDRYVEYETINGIARLWQNRPAKRNAQNEAMFDALSVALTQAEADPAVKVVVIAGRGDHFSAGHDVDEALQRQHTVEERWQYEDKYYFQLSLRVWDFPKPTIAQVQGGCIAGAFVLANMCDLIVASEDAFFADPVCHRFAAVATEVLIHPWVMGLRAAKAFLFTGEKMSAGEAHRIGMVNQVVARADLERATLALAQRIAMAPPFALRLTKRSLNRSADCQGLRNALQAHFDTHELAHNSAEFTAQLARND
jgi:enoyl-CoA hydratase